MAVITRKYKRGGPLGMPGEPVVSSCKRRLHYAGQTALVRECFFLTIGRYSRLERYPNPCATVLRSVPVTVPALRLFRRGRLPAP